MRPTYRGRTRRPPSLAISASSVGDEEPREHFNRACALLDLIGSGDPDQPTEAQGDLREHRRALMEALDVVLLVADAVEEADAVDAERTKRDEAPKRKATTGSVEHRNSGGQRAHVPDGQRSVGEHEHDFTRPLIRAELDREDPGRLASLRLRGSSPLPTVGLGSDLEQHPPSVRQAVVRPARDGDAVRMRRKAKFTFTANELGVQQTTQPSEQTTQPSDGQLRGADRAVGQSAQDRDHPILRKQLQRAQSQRLPCGGRAPPSSLRLHELPPAARRTHSARPPHIAPSPV